ncbi:YceI family protein [Mangrovimonas sp. DI 80]|uniref:YceI family protein n=1 Tax=Mangrovimonas sp. DI 80 TaxID=1779330 RepID=UPI0009780A88|nr:YceI family protein [Mangrovimonas sp. DI 80]OMP30376.1 lipid-binding protein [Mangrovimonas sp. DI 80]
MKKRIFNVFTVLALTMAVVSCQDKGKKATTTEAEPVAESTTVTEKFVIDSTESTIYWKGFKPTGSHHGTVKLEKGVFKANGTELVSGSFLIDMRSLVDMDMEPGDMKDKLEAHLKGTVEGKEGDFFDITKFPTAAFEITGSQPTTENKSLISGNLTIKGIKQNITFPISVTNEGETISIMSDTFTIDRTQWEINFRSKSIFDDLGDNFINDEIQLKFVLKATKA